MIPFYIFLALVGIAGSFVIGRKTSPSQTLSEEDAIKMASSKAQKIIIDAQKQVFEDQKELENKAKGLKEKINEEEKQLLEREKILQGRRTQLDKRDDNITKNENKLRQAKEAAGKLQEQLKSELEKVAHLTEKEAQQKLIAEVDEEMKTVVAKRIKSAVNKAKIEANTQANEILIQTMQNIATDFVSETTTSTLKIEDEKLKGRIIGREGRNIRAFEAATGVDVIVDESPNHVGISSFDPLRREIGCLSMKKLLSDGRIHPGRIEEVVNKVKREIAEEILKNGKTLAEEADWPDIPADFIKLLGKMKYRTSYGQSLSGHTKEVMQIGQQLAVETGANVELVKKACLLHDVGKLLTQKISKPHHHISGDLARKYGLNNKLVNAIEAHHGDIEPKSVEAVLVHIADAISGARPGARKESYEQYIKRVQALEDVAHKVGKDKVAEVYAIHAGREIRVIVKPTNINDDGTVILARKIAKEIEKTQTYPGNIQVVVIRETRATDTAK